MTRRITDIVSEGEALGVVGGVAASVPVNTQTASDVEFTPAGDLVATDVQAALVELDTEKAAMSSLGDLAGQDTVAVADISATGTPSATTYLRGDGSWQTPAGGGSSGLLAITKHQPGTTSSPSAGTTATVVDATNLTVSFTVPASGSVLVKMSARGLVNNNEQRWMLYEGGVLVSDSEMVVLYSTAAVQSRAVYHQLFTGLTPGASKTWVWYQKSSTGTVNVQLGGTQGPALMEIWDGGV